MDHNREESFRCEMISSNNNGFFISFEGVETSGKTTQADLLVSWLQVRGHRVVQTREPGGTFLGEAIRTLLLDMSDEQEMSHRAETLLFAAARAQLVETIIGPALAAGHVVVCDRYIDSSVAYQSFGLGVPLSAVWDINKFSTEDLMPDLTFVLGRGADLESSERRPPTDRIEAREERYHRRVRNGYLSLARRFPERIVVVDTLGGVRRTAGIIRRMVAARLKDRQSGF